jgi:YD repeat-containing protein
VGTVLASYQYDGDGRRVSKIAGSATTNYIYETFGRLAAEHKNGTLFE